ncbi:unnamed protein product [Aureobasidium pullulans]|nr:unnamed protein product [Aureobasidium pullulans]
MRLAKILGPVGAAVAVKAIWHNVPSFSTRFITKSPSVSTTQAVSWITLQQTSPVEKSEGWKVVPENPVSTADTSCGVTTVVVDNTPTITSYCGVTTVHVDSPQATATINANTTRPDDYVVAQRLAHAANLYWGRFPTKPDNETDRCVNSTTVDDGTQGVFYNNSTVNCTALMFGHRWHAWECDHNCQERLAIAIPAAFTRGNRGPLSEETTRALQAIARGQRSFMRLIRDYRRIAHRIHVEWQLATWDRDGFMEQIRIETERVARRFRLREEARARVRDRYNELSQLPTIWEEDETQQPFNFLLEIDWYVHELMGTRAVIRANNYIQYNPDRERWPDIPEEDEEEEVQPQPPPRLPVIPEEDEEELPKILEEEIPEQPPLDLISPFEPRPEQMLYDSMIEIMEAPPRPGEGRRPIRINEPDPDTKNPVTSPVKTMTETAPPTSIPTSIPTWIPISNPTSIPVSYRTYVSNNPNPSIGPSGIPSPVPISPPNGNPIGHMDVSADGTMILTGSGAWGLASGFSSLLHSKLSTCTPIKSWTFMTSNSAEGQRIKLAEQGIDFLIDAKLSSWNGVGQDQCFNKMISEVGGPADIGYSNGMKIVDRPVAPKPQPKPKQEPEKEKPKQEKPKKVPEVPKVNPDCCKCPKGWCWGWLGWHCCGY